MKLRVVEVTRLKNKKFSSLIGKGGKMSKVALPKDDVHLRLGIIKEAQAAGLNWLSQAFLVYQKIRWYETDGKFGFMVAGADTLGEQFGLTTQQTEQILKHLHNVGLIQHIWCDKKVYRNKTRIWMSSVRLRGLGTSAEAIRVIGCGKKNTNQLSVDPFELKKLEILSQEINQNDCNGLQCDCNGLQSDCNGLQSLSDTKQRSENKKENKKESKKEIYKEKLVENSRFKKPTVEEIKAYCQEKSYQVDAENFYTYYESVGWKRGKTPMKSWKMTLANWHRNALKWEKEQREKSSDEREKEKCRLDFL